MSDQPVDLDHVLLTPEALMAYNVFAQKIVTALAKIKAIKQGTKIPDERAQILPDGSLEVFVDLPSKKIKRVSFTIPPRQWQINT